MMSFQRLYTKLDSAAARCFRTRNIRTRNRRAVVSFTFDDFPKSAVSNGARLLAREGLTGSFYLSRVFCGRSISGIEYFSPDDLGLLVNAGHELGCHTASHTKVSQLSAGEIVTEIRENASFVKSYFHDLRMSTFAYPFGSIGLNSKLVLQRHFAGCRTSIPGLNSGVADLGALRAERLYSDLVDIRNVEQMLDQAVNSAGWLIFYTHDVTENPSPYGCTPELFEATLMLALKKGCEILSVRNALGAVAFG